MLAAHPLGLYKGPGRLGAPLGHGLNLQIPTGVWLPAHSAGGKDRPGWRAQAGEGRGRPPKDPHPQGRPGPHGLSQRPPSLPRVPTRPYSHVSPSRRTPVNGLGPTPTCYLYSVTPAKTLSHSRFYSCLLGAGTRTRLFRGRRRAGVGEDGALITQRTQRPGLRLGSKDLFCSKAIFCVLECSYFF